MAIFILVKNCALILFVFLNAFGANVIDTTSIETNASKTGIPLYEVDVAIQARFATTTVTMEMVNTKNCTLVRDFVLQVPRNARITSLTMELSDGCTTTSNVQAEVKAEENFRKAVEQGLAAAFLKAWNQMKYTLQISLPKNGWTVVKIKYSEILRKQQQKISFQLPLSPGLPADKIVANVGIREPSSGVKNLLISGISGATSVVETNEQTFSSNAKLEVDTAAAQKGDLPRLLQAGYDVGPLSENGVLAWDGASCMVHLFNPPSFAEAESMALAIVFVIDVSGSMGGQKLQDAKAAFSAMLALLTDRDNFVVQTFSSQGIESSWGPSKDMTNPKQAAQEYVRGLKTIGGTNLNDAYIQGIQKVGTIVSANQVPILLLMTDGQASSGETSSPTIAANVLHSNSDVQAKIFALAFGRGADMPLLMGIAIQNGGVAVPIFEGFGDSVAQMEDFFESYIGTAMASDLQVRFEGDRPVLRTTQTSFPIFANGSEVVVRAELTDGRRLSNLSGPSTIRAVTTARRAGGSGGTSHSKWTVGLDFSSPAEVQSGECARSFAHGKISELMNFKTAAQVLGGSMAAYADNYFDGRRLNGETNLAEQANALALELALEAELVWPGLTALITTQSDGCNSSNHGEEDVCHEGDGAGGGVESASDLETGQYSAHANRCVHAFHLSMYALLIVLAGYIALHSSA